MTKIQAEVSWKENWKSWLFKNKFIIFIILIIFWIFSFFISQNYLQKKVDRTSFVTLIEWQWLVNENLLKIDSKEKIEIWDTVRTIWNKALAIIEWWDGSVTRLWWNTSLKIEDLYLSDDLSDINIAFDLKSWKTWSTVISFLWEWSYFKEYFKDSEASVRWTVFNVDLTNDYLYVIDHSVDLLTSDWNNIIINENNPFSLETFSFLKLEEFINKIKDTDWENLNIKIDNELFNWLKEQIYSDFESLKSSVEENISKLKENENAQALYDQILSDYQKLNFISPENTELFNLKMDLKESLLEVSSEENKEKLVENTFYDLQSVVDNWTEEQLNKILNIFTENKEVLENINLEKFDINKKMELYIKDNISLFNELFWDSINKITQNFTWVNLENINIDSIKNIWEKADSLIQDGLNNLFNK